MIGYKLFRQRRDGTLGPLFINRGQVLPVGKWLDAEAHATPGFAYRPGWHATLYPVAPHLAVWPKSEARPRVWAKVQLQGTRTYSRPESQGGTWVLAQRLKILETLPTGEVSKEGK
jgi:hypothetical protein